MDLLIVGAGFLDSKDAFSMPLLPLALGELNSVARNLGHDVSVLDLNLELYSAKQDGRFNERSLRTSAFDDYISDNDPISSAQRLLFRHLDFFGRLVDSNVHSRPDVALFSIPYSSDVRSSLLVAKYLKSKNPDMKIVFGGSFFNDNPDFSEGVLIHRYSFIDVISTGTMSDIDSLLLALEDGSSLQDIPSIYFKDLSGDVVFSDVPSSRSTPMLCPDFSDFNIDGYSKIHSTGEILVPYRFMDGCPHSCSFCRFCLSQKFSAKEPSDVRSDLLRLKEQTGSSNFYFLNNMINISEVFLKPYLDVFSELETCWSDSARPENISPDFAALLKSSGCMSLTFGVESFSQKDLDLMNKGFVVDEVLDSLKSCHSVGIAVKVNLIYGFPFQTPESVSNMISTIGLSLPYVDFFSAFPFFVSGDMELNPKRYGLILHSGFNSFSEIDGRSKEVIEADQDRIFRLLSDYFQRNRVYCYFSNEGSDPLDETYLFLPLDPKYASFKEWAFETHDL